jgi:hypothetical protein
MIIAFLCTSLIMGLFISCVWSSRGVNLLIKMAAVLYTIWTTFILFAYFVQTVDLGSMRLF